jgi:hypothetical protein
MLTTEILNSNSSLTGFVKIWKVHPETGESFLLVDKKNMILKGGAKLIAHALGGKPEAKIWGMYIGYNNSDTSFLYPDINIDYTAPFSEFASPFGYIREPLTFTPAFLSSDGYEENTVLFSTMVTTASRAGGEESAEFNEDSRIYEVALVAAADPTNPSKDTVFSRTNFQKVKYDSTYNFTITWGVRILVP